MGREVIRVAKDYDWEKDKNMFLYISYEDALKKWEHDKKEWLEHGRHGGVPLDERVTYWRDIKPTLECFMEYCGGAPQQCDYLPNWKDEERTHYCMFSTITDSPMSPPMPTPHDLATWLVENNASANGHETASYEEWTTIIASSGSYPSRVRYNRKLISGVAFEAIRKETLK